VILKKVHDIDFFFTLLKRVILFVTKYKLKGLNL